MLRAGICLTGNRERAIDLAVRHAFLFQRIGTELVVIVLVGSKQYPNAEQN
jgi:hypothetical protein